MTSSLPRFKVALRSRMNHRCSFRVVCATDARSAAERVRAKVDQRFLIEGVYSQERDPEVGDWVTGSHNLLQDVTS